MKKSLLLSLALSVFVTAGAFANYRSAKIYLTSTYQEGYEIGNITLQYTPTPSAPGDYWFQPFVVANPITGGTDYGQIGSYISTAPFYISDSLQSISFSYAETINDLAIAQDPTLCKITTANVLLVDSATGYVLATVYASTPFCQRSWMKGVATGQFNYTVPAKFVGRTAVLTMTVTWNGSAAPAPFDAFETSGAWTLGYNSVLQGGATGKAALAQTPSAVAITNSPNPAVNFTTINVENARNVVSLKVYDVMGRTVADLTSQMRDADAQSIPLSTEGWTSGAYLYRLVTTEGMTQKTLIVKR